MRQHMLLGRKFLRVGRFRVSSYAVMLYLGFVCGVALGLVECGLDAIRFCAATLILLIPALLGGRLWYLLGHPEIRSRSWDLQSGGAGLYGGLILSFVLSWPVLRLLRFRKVVGAYGVRGGPAVALPALVLVHGGGLAGDSWDLTIDEIHRLAPELAVLAVDLPGRRGKPGDLFTVTLADFVGSVVDDIEHAGLDNIVLVGHSMAGLTVPGVAAKLGPSRVRELVLAAAFVTPEGKALVDTLTGPLALVARRNAKKGGLSQTPAVGIRFSYLNGVP